MTNGTTGMTLSPRKRAIRDYADDIAKIRDHWIDRNSPFHNADLAYLKFVIPEGSRVLELGCGTGRTLERLKPSVGVGVDFSEEMIEIASAKHPDLTFHVADIEALANNRKIKGTFDFILLSDTIGYLDDCEETFKSLHRFCDANTRLVVSYYSHLWEPALKLIEMLGLRMPQPEVNYLGHQDIANLLNLSDFEVIRQEWRQLVPHHLFGIGTALNRFIGTLPGIRRLCLRHYLVARSERHAKRRNLSATVLVPCRNEKGNIENAVKRLPRFADDIEILYVEGNSSDGTYEECERVRDAYKDEWDIKVFKQPGKGKGDAVRKGFDEARGDVLMILDADLTMPPEEIPKYYDAIARGKGEFINGTRLVYPMEHGAMRFLNYWANRTFALIFSYLLNQRFTDTLCGTKVITKKDYENLIANRSYFGDFDPFGDFDLIFGAAKLNLKIVEIPVRYADRTYGSPQISRFRDGWLLLKMVVFAWRKPIAF